MHAAESRWSTTRLVLRPWTAADHAPFIALNLDPEVMRHFPRPLPREETLAFIETTSAHIERHGYGFWAVERRDTRAFIGMVGLSTLLPEWHPCAGGVEVGWRLAAEHWGHGFATEAGREALRVGFEVAGLDEIVAYTATINAPSRAVMRRLGMREDETLAFEHPRLPPGHPLRSHVVYRLEAPGR